MQNQISQDVSKIKGSVEKVDNCFYLKLSRTPNDTKKINYHTTYNADITKKESLLGYDSVISNEENKILRNKTNKNINQDNKTHIKNGNMISNTNNKSIFEADIKPQINERIKNMQESNYKPKKIIVWNNKSKKASEEANSFKPPNIYNANNDIEKAISRELKYFKEGK